MLSTSGSGMFKTDGAEVMRNWLSSKGEDRRMGRCKHCAAIVGINDSSLSSGRSWQQTSLIAFNEVERRKVVPGRSENKSGEYLVQLAKIADGCGTKREVVLKSSTNIRAVVAPDVGRVENSTSLVMLSQMES